MGNEITLRTIPPAPADATRVQTPVVATPASTLRPLVRDSFRPSATVTPARALTRLTLDPEQLEAVIDRRTGTQATHGNSMELHVDGNAAYPRLMDMLRGAQRTIHIETFIFKGDDAGWDVAEVLAERAQHGVKVRVSADWMGSPTSNEVFDFMIANGVEVRHFTPNAVAGTPADHRKLILVDGARAMTGGMNIAEEYRDAWHDTMVTLQGPVVHDLQRRFMETWRTVGGGTIEANADTFAPLPARPAGNARMRVLTTVPRQDIRDALFTAIDAARSQVNIESAYFTDDLLVQKLCAAARRGVKVNLIVPMVSDVKVVDMAARHHFRDLRQAGVNLYLYHGRTMHTKAATVDGVWGMIGSANTDALSLSLNQEMVVTTTDAAGVATMDRQIFDHDMTIAKRAVQPPSMSVMQRIETWFARNFQPVI